MSIFGQSFYTRGTVYWLAALVGGLTFGLGMTLAGGCGQRTLVRLGGGNLKSIVVFLFLGYTALVTMNGILRVFVDAVLRADAVTLQLDGLQTLPALMGMSDKVSQLAVAIVLGLLILAFVFANKEFRENRDNLLAGVVVGGVVIAGWYATGYLGFGEDTETMELTYMGTDSRGPESMTFVGPAGLHHGSVGVLARQAGDVWRRQRVRRGDRVFPLLVVEPQLSLGILQFAAGHVPPHCRRDPDGVWWHYRHGLHHRSSGNGCFHFGNKLIHRILRNCCGVCHHHESSVLSDDAGCLMQTFHSSRLAGRPIMK
jgi:hypothetical protein